MAVELTPLDYQSLASNPLCNNIRLHIVHIPDSSDGNGVDAEYVALVAPLDITDSLKFNSVVFLHGLNGRRHNT